jgi:hypothetical protein
MPSAFDLTARNMLNPEVSRKAAAVPPRPVDFAFKNPAHGFHRGLFHW